ncbi:MAG: ATP synthase F1 subunit delta [Chitinophagaceae bacterium]|nr:ATP synthase F1 subunit delta [Chitinophagaceae bacterium]MCB9045417.1 ATP synthase F1 subunit delta [Chitinophagales bacterium]
MPNPRLASRYAKSLIDLAVEKNSVEDTLADIKYLDSICRNSIEFTNMLRSPVIHAGKKLDIITAVVGDSLKPLAQSFVKLLVSKGREENLPEIAHAFIQQYKEMKNIRSVKLITATPINDSLKQAIMTKVNAAVPGATIELSEHIDESLIGGFVLQMEDKLFDASIRRDLNDVKAQFRKNIYVAELR